jgi:predicted dehydrogenase
MKPKAWTDQGRSDEWTQIDGDPEAQATADERSSNAANGRVLDDWLAAIEQGREPACSGRAAMKAVEMAMAPYVSALTRSRVALPLAVRSHPLAQA